MVWATPTSIWWNINYATNKQRPVQLKKIQKAQGEADEKTLQTWELNCTAKKIDHYSLTAKFWITIKGITLGDKTKMVQSICNRKQKKKDYIYDYIII